MSEGTALLVIDMQLGLPAHIEQARC